MKSVKHIATVGVGGILAQLLTAGTMPALTRLYSPAAFAGWSILMSVILIFASVATLRYELAVVLPKSDEEASNVMASCVIISIAVSLVAAALTYAFGTILVGAQFSRDLVRWMWCIPLLILASGIYQACGSWCTRTQEFQWYAAIQVALPFFTVLGQVAAGLTGWKDVSGLIGGTILGQLAATGIVLVLIQRKYGDAILDSITVPGIRAAFSRYKNFPCYSTPYTLAGTVKDRVVYFLLGNFGMRVDVGFYNLSSRLMNMPNSLVAGAVRPVFFQKAVSTDFRSLEGPILQAMRCLVVFIAPFWAILAIHHEALFEFVFGKPWKEAGIYAVVLSVSAIPLLLSNWLDRTFDVFSRQRLALWLEVIFSTLSLAGLAAGLFLFHDTLTAIAMQAVILGIYYCCWLIALFQIAAFDKRNLLKLFLLFAYVAILSCGAVWGISIAMPQFQAIGISLLGAVAGVGGYLLSQKHKLQGLGLWKRVA